MAPPEDLVPEAALGEVLFPNAAIIPMKCDEDNVRKGRFVNFSSTENWPPEGHECDGGERIGGVALEDGDTGDFISILVAGFVKMYAGAAVTIGQALKSDAEGRAVPVAATDVQVGGAVAYMAAGEADDEFIVYVNPAVMNEVIA